MEHNADCGMIRLFGPPEVILKDEKWRRDLGAAMELLIVLILKRENLPDLANMSEILNWKLSDCKSTDQDVDKKRANRKSMVQKRRQLLVERLALDGLLDRGLAGVTQKILEKFWIDLIEYDEKITSNNLEDLRRAVHLLKPGHFAEGLDNWDVVVEARLVRDDQYRDALIRLIEADRVSDPAKAIQFIDDLIQTKPDEQYVAHYRDVKIRLEYHQLLERSGETARSSPEQSRRPLHILRHPTTKILGRTDEIAKITKYLRLDPPNGRFVTVSGPPGVGKTRLAIEIAGEIFRDFVDGVCFVSLIDLYDATSPFDQIGSTLELKEDAKKSWQDIVVDFLRDRNLLLVLDNCDEIAGACSEAIADILGSCSSVRIVSTSRQMLRVSGGQSFVIGPLALPSRQDVSYIEVMKEKPAVALFVERAEAAYSGFALTTENALAVFDICLKLEGLPLAIELAAALVSPDKSPAIIADDLIACLDILNDGPASPHFAFRSLRAAIDLSYQTLNSDDQRCFCLLGIFVGGFTLDAAAAIWDGAREERHKNTGALSRIARKSLVYSEPTDHGKRSRLLEPLRQYALEKLETEYEIDDARDAHHRFFTDYVMIAEPRLRTSIQKEWFERLEADHANILAALDWRRNEISLKAACALSRFWYVRGHTQAGKTYLISLISANPNLSDFSASLAIGALGKMEEALGLIDSALAKYQESLTLAHRTNDARAITSALIRMGDGYERYNDYENARIYYRQAIPTLEMQEDKNGLSDVLSGLGTVARNAGDYDEAYDFEQRSLDLRLQSGDQQAIARSYLRLGDLDRINRQYEIAQKRLELSCQMRADLGDRRGWANSLVILGALHLELKHFEEARDCVEQTLILMEEVGDRWGTADARNTLGQVAMYAGDLLNARKLTETARHELNLLGVRVESAATTLNLGEIAYLEMRLQDARAFLTEALNEFISCNEDMIVAYSLSQFGGLSFAEKNYHQAIRLWAASDTLFTGLGAQWSPIDAERRQEAINSVRNQVGDVVFTAEWAAGCRMNVAQAIACALHAGDDT